MRVLFIYPDLNVRGGEKSFNIGLGMLSAILKREGHETSLYHLCRRSDIDGIEHRVEIYKPALIAISSISPEFPFVREILERLKKYKIFTICGGPHPSTTPECLGETEGLDAICRGEGEYPLLELVEALENGKDFTGIRNLWIKRKGRIYQNPCRNFVEDLDSLPFADRTLFEYQEIVDSCFSRVDFMMTRGCPFNCTYCSNHVLRNLAGGRYVRFRSVDNCIDEMKHVLSRYHAEEVMMQDDVFTSRREVVLEFCLKYREEIGLPFHVQTRVEYVSPEIFRALREAGCYRIGMGIESGNSCVRDVTMHRRMDNEKIIQAFRWAHEVGLTTESFNIVGVPGETPEMHNDTVMLNALINPGMATLTIFYPYHGTQLYNLCKQNGYLNKRFFEGNVIARTDVVINFPEFPPAKILKAYRSFCFKVYWKHDLIKAIMLWVYHSAFGEILVRILAPFKKVLFRIAMKPKK